MKEEVIFFTDAERVAHVTLNRPHYHNAMDRNMINLLSEHFQTLHDSPHIKAVIIKGSGKSFCSGADLAHMKKIANYSVEENLEDAQTLSHMLELLNTLPMPSLTFAHGAVMGGGLGLLAASDIVIVDQHAKFAFSEVKLGIVPAIISPYVVEAIGFRQARRYFLTGEKFDSHTALHIGLAHQIIDLEKVHSTIDYYLSHILKNGPSAVRHAKKLLHDLLGGVPEHLRLSLAKIIANLRASDEGQSRLSSFLNKDS